MEDCHDCPHLAGSRFEMGDGGQDTNGGGSKVLEPKEPPKKKRRVKDVKEERKGGGTLGKSLLIRRDFRQSLDPKP